MKKEIVPVKLKANDHITIDPDMIAALDAAYEGAKMGSADTMLRDWYVTKERTKNPKPNLDLRNRTVYSKDYSTGNSIEDTTYEEVHDNPFPIKELKARLKELAPVDIDYEEVKPEQLNE